MTAKEADLLIAFVGSAVALGLILAGIIVGGVNPCP